MPTVLIIPALNEEQSIGRVLDEVPPGLCSVILVVDNGSSDRTAEIAALHGASVLTEPRRGYGNACLRAMKELPAGTELVLFLDGDGGDLPGEARRLIEPIERGEADFVVGSRELGQREPGALSPHQRFGNWLATALIHLLFGYRYTDLGPFRAIRAESLTVLEMRDPTYGWTVEMQIKALRHGLRVVETPVSCRRRRYGSSKVSGSISGSLKAGCKILWTIGRLRFTRAPAPDAPQPPPERL